MAENDVKKVNISRRVLVIFVILLLLFNAFLIFTLVRKNIKTTDELVSTTKLKEELEKEISAYNIQLADYKDIVSEKDTALATSQKEIEELKEKIEVMIQSGKITQSKYNAAKEEIAQLKYYVQKYQTQIEELKKQNKELTTENEGLKTKVTEIKKEVDVLTDQNVSLTNKVSLGAMLKTNSITVTGISVKGSKQKETLKGSKMEGLKITFSIQENTLAKAGEKDFYIKVINPKGETLYIEERGSGQFIYLDQQSIYTVKQTFDYQNSSDQVYKVYWAKGSPFEKGSYKTQVICDGVKIGEKAFTIE